MGPKVGGVRLGLPIGVQGLMRGLCVGVATGRPVVDSTPSGSVSRFDPYLSTLITVTSAMNAHVVHLTWKVISLLKNQFPIQQNNVVFNFFPNTGLYSQFSIPLDKCYVPQILLPTVVFHQAICRKFREWMPEERKQFPYRLYWPTKQSEVSARFKIRLFPPNILSITVRLSDFSHPPELSRLIKYQNLNQLKPFADITRHIIAMVDSLDHKRFMDYLPSTLNFKPALLLFCDISSKEGFQGHNNENLAKYVSILLGETNVDERISNEIFEKNRNLNRSTSSELLLLDKKGILYSVSGEDRVTPLQISKLSRVYDIYEVALAVNAYLKCYEKFRDLNEGFADFLLYKVLHWLDHTDVDVLFSNSYLNRSSWNLISDELFLESKKRNISKARLDAVVKRGEFFDSFQGWWNDPNVPLLIPPKNEDRLDMAEHSLEKGDKESAAVRIGIELENHLHKLCDKNGISTKTTDVKGILHPKKAEAINTDLANSGVYSKLDQKGVTAWLDLRNKAAHGHSDEYTSQQVELLLQSVRDFRARNPV